MNSDKHIKTVGDLAYDIVQKQAKQILKKLHFRVIRKVQSYGRETMQSADDSGLANLWDEYCVQLQSEEGFGFNLVEDLVFDICGDVLEELRKKDKISFNTVELFLNADHLNLLPEDEMMYDETTQILFNEVGAIAADYSNQRINNFLDY